MSTETNPAEPDVFETRPADTITAASNCAMCDRPMWSGSLTIAVRDALRAAGYLMPDGDVLAIADHLAAHDAEVRRTAAKETAERIATEFEEMATVWGGDEMWLTSGTKVAALAAGIVREMEADR